MNVVIVADEGYIQHAGVMLTSLFETNKGCRIRVFLLTNGISDDNQRRLECLCKAYGNSIEICQPDSQLSQYCDIDKLNSSNWSKMIYYKLFMPHILPLEVERCLFLDVDMVVVDNLNELYNIPLNPNAIIAAVEDVISCLPRKDTLGLSETDPYINSGVMVCDIARWREEENNHPIFDFVIEHSNVFVNEQDVIATYMKGRIQLLPIKWNMVGCNYLRKKFVFPKYYAELSDARKHPAIHHFCTLIQPWYADSPHPYKHLYTRYLGIYAHITGAPVNMKLPYKTKPKTFLQKVRHFIARTLNAFDIIKQPGYVLHKFRY